MISAAFPRVVRPGCRFALVVVVTVVAAALSSAAAAELELPYRVAVGDRFAVEVRREREREEGGQPVFRVNSTTPVIVEVLDQLADGWVMVWTYGTTVVEDGDEAVDPAERTISTIADGLRLEFETDGRGRPLGIRDEAEVRRHLRYFAARYVNTLVRGASRGGAGLAEIAQLRRTARARAALYLRMNDNQLNEFILDDARTLTRVSGRVHSDEQPSETVVEAVDVASGEVTTYVDRSRLREMDPASGLAILDWWRETAADDAGLPPLDPPAPAPPAPDTHWKAVYTVEVESGLVRSVNAERMMAVSGTRVVERSILTQSRTAAAP